MNVIKELFYTLSSKSTRMSALALGEQGRKKEKKKRNSAAHCMIPCMGLWIAAAHGLWGTAKG